MSDPTMTIKLISREFDGFARSFAKQAEFYARNHTGATVQCEFVEIHQLYDRMIKAGEAGTDEHDLFLCVTDWLPEAIRDGLLTPLNDWLERDPPEGWPDGWSPSMRQLQTAPDGQIYGIAYHDGPEMFIYRRDLFADPAERSAFAARFGYPLEVPQTWEQFLDVAAFFNRPEQGLSGALIAGYPDGHNNVYDFLIQLWSRGGELVDADWQPAFANAVGEEALQFLVDLVHKHRVVPLEALELDSVKSGDYFAQGRAAMMWNWCGFAAVAELPDTSKVAGKVGTGLIPRGSGPQGRHTSLNIYWVLAIPAGSRNKDAAYRFIKDAASAEMDRTTSLSGGNGTRLSTWRDPEVRRLFPYYERIEEVHRSVDSPLPIPEYPAINEVLSDMTNQALRLRKPVRQAIAAAAAEIGRILREAGYSKED